jgi:hypothetical protein
MINSDIVYERTIMTDTGSLPLKKGLNYFNIREYMIDRMADMLTGNG